MCLWNSFDELSVVDVVRTVVIVVTRPAVFPSYQARDYQCGMLFCAVDAWLESNRWFGCGFGIVAVQMCQVDVVELYFRL